jgi:hypothetical protein
MSKFNTIRTGLLGSAALVSLLAVAPAQAVEAQYGDVSITFDTTVSMGASMLTEEVNTQFLPEVNGGPVDPRMSGVALPNGILVAPFSGAFGGGNAYSGNPRDNHDGSANADDGRLNFGKGDLIGANVKASHDLQVTWQNYRIFARGVGFYDVIMNDEDAGSRSKLTDQALGDVGRNYELLDLFVSADYSVGDIPVNLRVGKQVINWGESTFIQNGLNVFNPIDVSAIRRPGSEIKEALVPVNAVSGTVTFPIGASLSAWYALDWEAFELDPSGTPFSTADSIAYGTGVGGNSINGRPVSFVTAGLFAGQRRNCITVAGQGTRFAQTNGLLPDPQLSAAGPDGNGRLECNDSPFVSHVAPLPIGQHEYFRLGQISGGVAGVNDLSGDGLNVGNGSILLRGEDHKASDDGQYGLKLTMYAEELNGTEFGFYFQNYHSRLPFVSLEADPTATNANLGYFVNGSSSNIKAVDFAGSIQSRQLNNSGCGLTSPAQIGTIGGGAFAAANFGINSAIGALGNPLTPGTAAFQMANTPVDDPTGQLATAAAAVTAITGGGVALNNALANGNRNQLAVAQLNCVLTYFQSGLVVPAGGAFGATPTVQTFDGAEFLLATGRGTVATVYPENVQSFGFSFNTTVEGIGVQFETSYRPEAPFQIDTDSLTIASLVNSCVFTQLYGAAGLALGAQANNDGSGVRPGCGKNIRTSDGVMYNEMLTAQLGTTSSFTGSDWFVDALGAEGAVIVSEVGMVLVPGVEDTWVDDLPAALKGVTAQYQNTGCQGTDLALAGALSLDKKKSGMCRPTDFSAGLVMLFSLQYNNFMDTGFAVSPRLVYSYDFEGTTAAPYSNYLEDRQAINLGVDGTLNNNLRVGMSYSNFFGGHINNKSRDRDFTSISASYTF